MITLRLERLSASTYVTADGRFEVRLEEDGEWHLRENGTKKLKRKKLKMVKGHLMRLYARELNDKLAKAQPSAPVRRRKPNAKKPLRRSRKPKRDTRQRVLDQLRIAKERTVRTWKREGKEQVWWNAEGLDAGMLEKKQFAVVWREAVLELEGYLRERKVRVTTGHGTLAKDRTFRVFSANGTDQIAVCASAGPNFTGRLVRTHGQSFTNICRKRGWTVITN